MLNLTFKEKTRGALILARKEIVSFLASPVAYIVFTIFLIITGYLFFNDYYLNQDASFRNLFQFFPLILAVFIPAVTMRLFAEEKATGSFELLVTMPLTSWEIVAGKFLAAVSLSLLLIAPTLLYAITIIATASSVDVGPMISGFVGAILLAGTYAAIGIFASILSSSQVIALITSFFICILLAILQYGVQYTRGVIPTVLEQFGTDYHFKNFAKGLFDFRDLVYFCSVIFLFMLSTKKVIDDRR